MLGKSLELLQRQQLNIMQQFGASAFYAVVRWHKQNEIDIECTLHISVVLAMCVPKIIKFDGDLTKFWQKQVGLFLATLYTHLPYTSTAPYKPIIIISYNSIRR